MRELDYKESWVVKNWCFWTLVLEKTLESPLDCREIKPVILKEFSPEYSLEEDWCWSWNSNTLATWCEEPTHWKRLWCWERLKVGGEQHDRGWDHWMLSPTRWTWVWASSGSLWWTGKPGVLQSMGPQRVRHNWGTELTELMVFLTLGIAEPRDVLRNSDQQPGMTVLFPTRTPFPFWTDASSKTFEFLL